MKKLILMALCTFAFAVFAELQRDKEHTATIDPINVFEEDIEAGYISVTFHDPITDKDVPYSFYGVRLGVGDPVNALDAPALLQSWQNALEAACAALPKQLKASNVAKWSEMMASVIKDGLKRQQAMDTQLVKEKLEEVEKMTEGYDEAIQQLQTDADALALDLDTKAQTASAQFKSMSQTISANKSELSTMISANKSRIDTYNNELRGVNADLKKLEGKTDEESIYAREQLLIRKKEIEDVLSTLNASSAAAMAAQTAMSAANAKLVNMEARLNDMVSKPILYSELRSISKWNGYTAKNETSEITTFMPPYKTDYEHRYNTKKGETVENFLGDRGVMQYDTLEYQAAREESPQGYYETPYFQISEYEGGGKVGTPDRYTMATKQRSGQEEPEDMLPPKNWVDGVTIIYTNGHYTAVSGGVVNVDFVSVGTKMVRNGSGKWESKTEIYDFHTLNEKSNKDEYDYAPNATYTYDGDDGTYYIEWQTNDVEAIKKALGLKKSPKKSQLGNLTGSLRDEFFADGGLVQKVLGKTGVVERLNAAIKIENAWDNKSIWTNGEAKVEIKGFHNHNTRDQTLEIPLRSMGSEDDDKPILMWKPYLQGDGDYKTSESAVWQSSISTTTITDEHEEEVKALQLSGFDGAEEFTVPVVKKEDPSNNRYLEWEPFYEPDTDIESTPLEKSIDSRTVVDTEGKLHHALYLYGFDSGSRKTGSVPFENADTSDRKLQWADPPDDVSSGAPKVLTFDGSTVAWGDGGSGGTAIAFVGTDGGTAVCGEGAKTNTVTFASDTNSNVIVSCEGNGNGNVKITIGVYYADEGL